MKIGITTRGLSPALETLMKVQIEGLQPQFEELGHHVEIISPIDMRKKHLLNNFALLNEISFGLYSSVKLARFVKRNELDVVHHHSATSAYFFAKISKSLDIRIPKILEVGTPFHLLGNPEQFSKRRDSINKLSVLNHLKAFSEVDRIVVNSNFLKNTFINDFNLDNYEFDVVYVGVDVMKFMPLMFDRSRCTDKIILNVGAVATYKNQLSLIKAIPKVIEEHPNAKFLFIGPIIDNLYFTKISNYIKLNGLEKVVLFKGAVPHNQLNYYYNIADAVVFPSILEGCPRVLLEAMSCMRPCIVSDLGFNQEIDGNLDALMFFDPFDCNDIANKVIEALFDKEKRAHMAQNARDRILSNFNWAKIAKDYLSIYAKLVN